MICRCKRQSRGNLRLPIRFGTAEDTLGYRKEFSRKRSANSIYRPSLNDNMLCSGLPSEIISCRKGFPDHNLHQSIRPDEGSTRLGELEEPPEGGHWFVAFETIVPVGDWI